VPAAGAALSPLTLVVFTTGRLGIELAARLAEVPEAGALHLVTTELPGRGRGVMERARLTWRRDGPPGVAQAIAGRLLRPFRPAGEETLAAYAAERCPSATHRHLRDLHAADALAQVRALAPDLGVVFGCYRLRRELFGIPRLGALNLHLGRAPEFRGSSPGFYEMLAGVAEVGVTVHRIDEGLDSGRSVAESFPWTWRPRVIRWLPGAAPGQCCSQRRPDDGGRSTDRAGAGSWSAPCGGGRLRASWALKQELRRWWPSTGG
jgi:hypothetical protein